MRILLLILILLVPTSFYFGMKFNHYAMEKTRDMPVALYDLPKDHPSNPINYMYTNALTNYERKVQKTQDRIQEEASWSWFLKEYNQLETNWQVVVSKLNHNEFPGNMPESVIRFKIFPMVRTLMDEVKAKHPPHEKEKLEILDLRMKSLEALRNYYKDEKFDKESYQEYKRLDDAYRNIVAKSPEIFD
jgi:hypothetical protein